MAKRTKVVSQTGRDAKAGFISAEIAAPDVPDYVVVELRYESPVGYTRSRFSAPAAAAPQADTLNDVLAKYDIEYSEDESDDEVRNKLAEFYAQRTLTKVPIEPKDQAEAFFLLVSDRLSKTTGQIVAVNGGLHEAFLR